MLGAGDAARIVLAGDEPAFAVARVAVGVVGGIAEDADMAVVFGPAHDAIVGDVAPEEVAAVADIDRTFAPAKTGGDALDAGIADFLEARVQRFDARIGIARAGQGAERQLVGTGELRCRGERGSARYESASVHGLASLRRCLR